VPTVRLPSLLRRFADGVAEVEVDASTLMGVINALVEVHPTLGPRLLDKRGRLVSHVLVLHRGELVKPEYIDEAEFDPSERVDLLLPISGGAHDVRMKGFRERASVEAALDAALDGVAPLATEEVPPGLAAGRVLAGAVVSDVDIPPFRRAAMDGYAVRAEDTFGASGYDPVELAVVGSSMPGVGPDASMGPGEALRIMTGAPVPTEADAVLRAEDATLVGDVVEVRAAVASGRHVGRVGEDVDRGDTVLEAGRRVRAQDAALLASIGVPGVLVHRRPRVRIVVSGDELRAPGDRPGGFQIVDSNSVMLTALVERDGGLVEVVRVPDDEAAMREALRPEGVDVVVTSGAASVGAEDRVPLLVDELGELVVHGVAMRPSSPTGVGRIDGVPVLILPGNPVSCLVAYEFFAGPVVRRLGGRPTDWPHRFVHLPLGERLVSQVGRVDYARVRIDDGHVFPIAVSGASRLSSLTEADGFVIVPKALEGFPIGAEVRVGLFEGGQ
jgi:molybdopterin molybdotransferase